MKVQHVTRERCLVRDSHASDVSMNGRGNTHVVVCLG
jgi:hypothetical protein